MGGFYVRLKVTCKSSHQSTVLHGMILHHFSIGAVTDVKSPLIYIAMVSYMGAIYMSKPLNFDAIDQLV